MAVSGLSGRAEARMSGPSASVRAVVVSIIVVMLGLSPVYLVGALGLQIRAELGFGATELGLAVGAFFAATALLSPFLGAAADRIGTVPSLRIVTSLLAVSCISIFAFARSISTLVLCLLLGGVANGLAGPATGRLVAYHVRSRRSLAFGLRQSAVPLATLLAGLSVPLLGLTFGWRFAFGLAGAMSLLVLLGVGSAVIAPDRPPARSEGEIADLRGLLLAGAAFFFATAAGTSLMAFLVDLSVERGVGEARGGVILATVSAVAIVARIGVGWMADRPRVDSFRIMRVQLGMGLIGFLILAVPLGAVGILTGATLAIAAGWGWTGLMAHVVAQGSPRAPARAAGIVQAGGASGGVLGPPLAGYLIDTASHEVTWIVMLGSLMLAFAAVTALRTSRLTSRFIEGKGATEVGAGA